MILLETVSGFHVDKTHSIDGDKQIERRYNSLEFTFWDFRRNELWCGCFPPLVDCLLPSPLQKLLVVGNTAYLVGGRYPVKELQPILSTLQKDPASAKEYYTGASRLHFSKIFEKGYDLSKECMQDVLKAPQYIQNEPGTKPIPVMEWYPMISSGGKDKDSLGTSAMPASPGIIDKYSRCTSLGGRLFNFDEGLQNSEVFDPTSDRWKKLKPWLLPKGWKVSIPVIPDASKNEIIMQLTGGSGSTPYLLAFCPERGGVTSGDWKRLSTRFPKWGNKAVAVNGLIYFHSSVPLLIEAYDTRSGKEVDVEWSTPPMLGDNDIRGLGFEFDDLLVLSDGLFCLVGHTCIHDQDDPFKVNTAIVCLKFKAEPKSKKIIFHPYPCVHCTLEETSCVHSYVPI